MTDPELWRRWLDDPAVARAPSEHTAPRRGRRARTGTADRRSGGRGRLLAAAAAGIAVAVGVFVAVSAGSGQRGGDTGHPYAIATTVPSVDSAAATSVAPPPFCSPGQVGATVVTNSAGDRRSAAGVIAAYEYAFFVVRDPRAALDVTDRGPGVPAEAQLAQAIADVAPGAPWCVSITDLGGGVYETAVRYLPAPGQQPVVWLLHMTVTESDGTNTIVHIDDKAG
ncbi:hypothetical protein [Nocardia wallacei]|uniref:hypothetical protein n=1 Tax=Nocardia wallacei TaxID=480035 RepID=UPI0024555280|nr:hypothetical protein [Nocardia wallacei]